MTSTKTNPGDKHSPHQDDFRKKLILVAIRHGLRPAAIMFVALLAFIWLLTVGSKLDMLKGPGFEASFDREIVKKDLKKELVSLQSLSHDQLQLFLIVARDRGRQKIHYSGPEARIKNWEALQEADLLTFRPIEDGNVEFTITPKANQLHILIFNSLYEIIH